MTARILTDAGWRNVMGMDPRPPKRIKASREEWETLRDEKLRGVACRVCSASPLAAHMTLHHLVSKSLGGDDVAANLVALCGSGTTGCHGLVEARDPWACSVLGARLSVAERAYVVGKKGAYFLESRYGVKDAA